MHTLFFPDLPPGDSLIIDGDEAKHAARVKRLRAGDPVRVINGAGGLLHCRVADTRGHLALAVLSREVIQPARPRVDVWSATPKGARVEEMIDLLTQIGAASWTPLATKLGVVDPREGKLSRLERIVIEACKQSARPWLLRIGDKRTFHEAVAGLKPGDRLVIADRRGAPYTPTGAEGVRVLIGPEGGFTDDERAAAARAGALAVDFGPHTMRIEAAAAAAAAVILNAERGRSSPTSAP